MRFSLATAWMCLGFAACGSAPEVEDSKYVEPNSLMATEISDRIAQIPYQQQMELVNNLEWLAQTGEQAIPLLLEALKDLSLIHISEPTRPY